MKNNTVILLLILILSRIYIYYNYIQEPLVCPVPNPAPIPAPVVPKPDIPELDQYVYNDEYEKCLSLSKKYQKNILLIFSADWCPHCRKLKNGLEKIEKSKKYIICIVDTDKNKQLTREYKIKSLPTSIIIDVDTNIVSSRTGYSKDEYERWIETQK